MSNNSRTILGMTLTKRGWNNVLIYVVLIFMFVFYFLGHKQQSMSEAKYAAPFAQAPIVALEDKHYSLVRLGNDWRQERGDSLTEDQIKHWVAAWQQLEVQESTLPLSGQEYRIDITLLDEQEAVGIVVFFSAEYVLLALEHSDYVYQVMSDTTFLRLGSL